MVDSFQNLNIVQSRTNKIVNVHQQKSKPNSFINFCLNLAIELSFNFFVIFLVLIIVPVSIVCLGKKNDIVNGFVANQGGLALICDATCLTLQIKVIQCSLYREFCAIVIKENKCK